MKKHGEEVMGAVEASMVRAESTAALDETEQSVPSIFNDHDDPVVLVQKVQKGQKPIAENMYLQLLSHTTQPLESMLRNWTPEQQTSLAKVVNGLRTTLLSEQRRNDLEFADLFNAGAVELDPVLHKLVYKRFDFWRQKGEAPPTDEVAISLRYLKFLENISFDRHLRHNALIWGRISQRLDLSEEEKHALTERALQLIAKIDSEAECLDRLRRVARALLKALKPSEEDDEDEDKQAEYESEAEASEVSDSYRVHHLLWLEKSAEAPNSKSNARRWSVSIADGGLGRVFIEDNMPTPPK